MSLRWPVLLLLTFVLLAAVGMPLTETAGWAQAPPAVAPPARSEDVPATSRPQTTAPAEAATSEGTEPADKAAEPDAEDAGSAAENGSTDPGEAPSGTTLADSADSPTPTADDEEFFELLKLFADTVDQVERNYVQKVSRRELMEAAIQGVLGKLDEYSNYIRPEDLDQFRAGVENEFGGIGIRVGMIEEQLTVITPLCGTPAYRAGVLAGDQILRIGQEDTRELSLNDAIRRMKGPVGTELQLAVRHVHDGSEETLTVRRERVFVETVLGYRRNADDSWDYFCDANQHIGYIRIVSFSRQTHEDLRDVLRQLQERDVRGVILDLRFNPGGLLSSAIQVADLFLAQGTIVSTEGRNTPSKSWTAKAEGTFRELDLVVLVNRHSASASEIVAACLQDHARAVVIGERTWGKGSVQNIIELENGRSAIKLTTAGYFRPSGKNIDRFEGAGEDDDWGVHPNDGHQLSLTPDEMRQLLERQRALDVVADRRGLRETTGDFVDRQLQMAMDYLGEQLAQR